MLDRLPIAILAGIVGWCLGWASAWLTDWLHPPEDSRPVSAARGLVAMRDPLVQGASALVWAAIPIFMPGDWLRWTEAGLLALPLIQVAVTDMRTRYVYTVVAGIGLCLGLACGWHVHGGEWWTGFAGAAAGFAAFGALYLLGLLLYRGRVEAMARGDITIAAMVGAGAAACTPQALLLGVLIGGVLAVGYLVARRSGRATMPYGPGLCLGGLATLFLC
jgi:hypothetical protein